MDACPYVEKTFDILGKKWSAMIIHYLYGCDNYETSFTDIKHHINHITPRALSLRLTELVDESIICKSETHYRLTNQGVELASAITPLQEWGKKYLMD